MNNFTGWLDRQIRTATTGLRFLFTNTTSGLDFLSTTGNATPYTVLFYGLGFAGTVGMIDVVTPIEMDLHLFYLISCALAGWIAGPRAAIFTGAVSEIFCFCDTTLCNDAPHPDWIIYWNSVVRLIGFLAFGCLAAEMRRARELDFTVQQHTTRLQKEADEHHQTLTRLQEALQLFRQLAESITDVFWVADPSKTRINYLSPEFEKVWGLPQKTAYMSPKVWLEGIHPEDRERVAEAARTRQAAGNYDEEFRVVRPDNTVRWVHERAFPVKNETGKVYRIVGICEDITDRRQMDETVRTQARVLESMAEAVLMSDPDGVIRLANPAAERMFGYESGELLGKSLSILMSPHASGEKAGEFQSGITSVKTKGSAAGEYLLRRKDGTQRLVSTRSSGLTLGKEFYVVTVGQDITERVRLERQILEISDREQARIGQDIHDGLCQKLISMGFDVNSLTQSTTGPESALCRRISDLLDESITESRRVARGLYPVRLETEGLLSALKELAQTMQERFNVPCVCECSADDVPCEMTTATQLYRIAQEAVNNALKHGNAHQVTIRVDETHDGIQLTIEDDGIGIGLNSTKESGMGMHIMDYRARTLGGSLRVTGGTIRGTVVSCCVPTAVNGRKL